MCSLSPETFVRSSNETAVDFEAAFFHPIPPGIPPSLLVPSRREFLVEKGGTGLMVRLWKGREIDHFVVLDGFEKIYKITSMQNRSMVALK